MDSPDPADLSFDQLIELDRRADQRAVEAETGPGTVADTADPIVLPWWQHPVNIVTMLVTAAILAAMVGWMVADTDSRVRHNAVDTGFLQDMREHHEQAVVMGLIYSVLPDTEPGLRIIATGIVRGQSVEVGRMIQMLRDFGETEVNETDTAMAWMGMPTGIGQMPGMASDEQIDRLGRLSGAAADRFFVELMTAHHLGGIHMADYAAQYADSAEVRAMAASMAGAQRGEIAEMEGELD
ncbi:MAG TPA: DUF305 domain-containing protein [Ilumatobacter sp.]